MKTFDERLFKILVDTTECSEGCGIDTSLALKSKQAILKIIVEVIPESPWQAEYKDCPAAWVRESYKHFRNELLTRLGIGNGTGI